MISDKTAKRIKLFHNLATPGRYIIHFM